MYVCINFVKNNLCLYISVHWAEPLNITTADAHQILKIIYLFFKEAEVSYAVNIGIIK